MLPPDVIARADEGVRSGARALQLARALNAATRGAQWRFLVTLAAAHAEDGDFESALRVAREARARAAGAAGNAGDVPELIEACLESFRAGRPYRSPR